MRAGIAALFMLVAVLAAQVPEVVATHVRRGVEAREAGRLQEAHRELEAAVRAAPELAEAHMYLGLVLHESRDYAAAAEALERALSLKTGLRGARELLGYDLLVAGRAAEAVPHLEAARIESPGNWRVSKWLGRARLEAGNPGDALADLLDAQSGAPADPELLYLVGKAYSQLALRAQAKLLSGAPESPYAHLATAEDHDFNGRADEAIAAYRKAVAGNGSLAGAWQALGDLEQSRGEHRAALEAYRQVLETQAGNGTLHLRCGEALLALGRAEEALPHLELAAGPESAPPAALAAFGKALLDLGRFAEARTILRRALAGGDGEEDRMRLHYQLARTSRKLGDVEAEGAHLKEFRTLRARLTSGDR